eukprot:390984-Pleurochrysis_carterae.AAC.2
MDLGELGGGGGCGGAATLASWTGVRRSEVECMIDAAGQRRATGLGLLATRQAFCSSRLLQRQPIRIARRTMHRARFGEDLDQNPGVQVGIERGAAQSGAHQELCGALRSHGQSEDGQSCTEAGTAE